MAANHSDRDGNGHRRRSWGRPRRSSGTSYGKKTKPNGQLNSVQVTAEFKDLQEQCCEQRNRSERLANSARHLMVGSDLTTPRAPGSEQYVPERLRPIGEILPDRKPPLFTPNPFAPAKLGRAPSGQ